MTVDKSGVTVATASAAVELGLVQPPGKRPMPAADWARGARVEQGERVG
jgi:methionyl-tRNA formyltransferase